MNEEGGHLGAMAYQVLVDPILNKLRAAHMDSADPEGAASIDDLRSSLKQADQSSPSFLFDLTRILLADSQLDVNLQESFLRLQVNVTEDLKIPEILNTEFQELSRRVIALRNVLSRIPQDLSDRRAFLTTIKEIAASIKMVLDVTNAVMQMLPVMHQQAIERRKRDFVHYSKCFSNVLKDYFRTLAAQQVSVSANQLIFQTIQIVRTVREKAMTS